MLAAITGLPAPEVQMPYALAWLAVGMENVIADACCIRAPAHPFEGVKMARHKMFFDASKAVRNWACRSRRSRTRWRARSNGSAKA